MLIFKQKALCNENLRRSRGEAEGGREFGKRFFLEKTRHGPQIEPQTGGTEARHEKLGAQKSNIFPKKIVLQRPPGSEKGPTRSQENCDGACFSDIFCVLKSSRIRTGAGVQIAKLRWSLFFRRFWRFVFFVGLRQHRANLF